MSLGNAASYAAHLAAAVDPEFLVVPRSDIVGTEYSWQHEYMPGQWMTKYPAGSPDQARAMAAARLYCHDSGDTRAVARPVLPWSPIPLPEEKS